MIGTWLRPRSPASASATRAPSGPPRYLRRPREHAFLPGWLPWRAGLGYSPRMPQAKLHALLSLALLAPGGLLLGFSALLLRLAR